MKLRGLIKELRKEQDDLNRKHGKNYQIYVSLSVFINKNCIMDVNPFSVNLKTGTYFGRNLRDGEYIAVNLKPLLDKEVAKDTTKKYSGNL